MKHLLFFLCMVYAAGGYAQTRPSIKNVAVTNVRCNGQANGTITITASNGRPPYNYSIDGGRTFQPSNLFVNLKAGAYTIRIRDTFNTLSDSQRVTLTEPSRLIVSCAGSMQCGGNSGVVSVTVSGGTPPYSYSWNAGPQRSDSVQTGLPAGTYIATVFDANQCFDTCSVILKPQGGSSIPKYKVGDSMSCGYVVFVDTTRDDKHPCATRYLICSFADQSNSVTWYNTRFTYTVTGATNDIIFDRSNAVKIDSFSLAANTCSKFSTDSCKGWYLPSKAELSLIYKTLAAKNTGGFAKEGYWTSVEAPKRHTAWLVDFLNGREIQSDKANKYHVRAVCEVWIDN